MISQLKLLLKILLSTDTVIIQFCLVEAAGNPGKNETDFIAQYRECVGVVFLSHKQAILATKHAIEIYNNERWHESLNYDTPSMRHAA
jgi:transposase InsO family protein